MCVVERVRVWDDCYNWSAPKVMGMCVVERVRVWDDCYNWSAPKVMVNVCGGVGEGVG